MIVDGLNLAGFCKNFKDEKQCGEYNVLPIGFIDTSDEEGAKKSLTDIKKVAGKINHGILTNDKLKKIFDYDSEGDRICPRCKMAFPLVLYDEAIFYRCSFRMNFKLISKEVKTVEGLIAHHNMYAKFDQNLKECRMMEGVVSCLTEKEEFN